MCVHVRTCVCVYSRMRGETIPCVVLAINTCLKMWAFIARLSAFCHYSFINLLTSPPMQNPPSIILISEINFSPPPYTDVSVYTWRLILVNYEVLMRIICALFSFPPTSVGNLKRSFLTNEMHEIRYKYILKIYNFNYTYVQSTFRIIL